MSEESYPASVQWIAVFEAQRRATFTVLLPDRLPTGLQPRPCGYRDATSWTSEMVTLAFSAGKSGQQVTMVQMAEADAPQHYGMMLGDECWREVLCDGTLINITAPGQRLYYQAYLTRDGTFAFLKSEDLTGHELATIAASLRPAPQQRLGSRL